MDVRDGDAAVKTLLDCCYVHVWVRARFAPKVNILIKGAHGLKSVIIVPRECHLIQKLQRVLHCAAPDHIGFLIREVLL
jgi:hypothetical protein